MSSLVSARICSSPYLLETAMSDVTPVRNSTHVTFRKSWFAIALMFVGPGFVCGHGPNDSVTDQWLAMERVFKGAVDQGFRSLLPHVLKMSEDNDLSPPCTSAFIVILRKLRSLDRNVLRMVDASGKLAPGLLEGSLTEFGNFDECLSVAVGDDPSALPLFRGQYCMVKARPPLPPKPWVVSNHFQAVNFSLFPETSVIRELLEDAGTFYATTTRMGLCMPSSCSKQDVESIVKGVFHTMHWSAVVSYCTINEKPDFTTKDVVIVCILCCLSLPVVLSTLFQTSIFIWDAFSKCPPKHGLTANTIWSQTNSKSFRKGSAIQWLSSLSAYETARKILVVRAPKDEDSRHLQAFHGLRALSIIWVVWVHHYAYNDISVYSGAKMAKKLVVQYNTQLFNNGWLAVDTFFFVSGFFLVHAVSKHVQPFGVTKMFIYTVIRWWRLIPLACIGICMLILIRFVGDGPLWNELISAEIDKCKQYWWLLMLNGQNFLRHDELCLVPYWYISVDTQLQIIFIGFVALLFRRTYLALFLMGLMVMVGVAVVMGQTLFNDYQPTALFVAGDLLFSKHLLSEVYFRPYTHFGPFCLGIVVAYAFVSKLTHLGIGKVFQAVCWVVSLCSSATILFCTKEWGSGDVPSPWVSAAYAGTHRLGWGLCLAWVVVACVSGRGGIVNTILSSRLLVPISRLSYSIYVLHVPLVWLRMWTIRERILISFMPMFYNGMGTFILSLVVAFLGTLFFERSLTAVKDVAFGFFSSLGRDEKAKPSSEKKTTFNIVFQTCSSSDPIFSGENVAKVPHFSTGTCSPSLSVKDHFTVRL